MKRLCRGSASFSAGVGMVRVLSNESLAEANAAGERSVVPRRAVLGWIDLNEKGLMKGADDCWVFT